MNIQIRLAELLRAPTSGVLQCVATAPGHIAVAVSGGKYVHTFDARGEGGGHGVSDDFDIADCDDENADDATSPLITTLRAAFDDKEAKATNTTRSKRGNKYGGHEGDGMSEDGEDTHLCYFGQSPVVKLLFVSTGFATDDGESIKNTLLAVTENGAVAAWRWDEGFPGATRPRWVSVAEPLFPGGAPFVAPPLDTNFRGKHGVVTEAAICVVRKQSGDDTRDNKQDVMKLVCLTSGVQSCEDTSTKKPCPALFARELRAGPENNFISNRGDVTVLSQRVPHAKTLYSSGGSDLWVVSSTETEIPCGESYGQTLGSENVVAARWCLATRRAVRRVHLSKIAHAADSAVEAAMETPVTNQTLDTPVTGKTRNPLRTPNPKPNNLTTCLHSPSNELLLVTRGGCVLAVGPGLDATGFCGNEDEDGNENEKEAREEGKDLEVRLVGMLQCFATKETFPSRTTQSCAAVGPFLYLASVSGFDELLTPAHSSSISCHHVSSGICVGVGQLPAAPLRETEGDGVSRHDKISVTVAGSAEGGVFVAAGSALFSVSVNAPRAFEFALQSIQGNENTGLCHSIQGNENTKSRYQKRFEHAHSTIGKLSESVKQTAWFGKSLQRAESAAALCLVETDIQSAMEGMSIQSGMDIQSGTTESKTNHSSSLTTRAMVTAPALVLQHRRSIAGTEGPQSSHDEKHANTRYAEIAEKRWRSLAAATVSFFEQNYPATGGAFLSRAKRNENFLTFTELGATASKDARHALGSGTDDDVSVTNIDTELDCFIDETDDKTNGFAWKLALAGLRAIEECCDVDKGGVTDDTSEALRELARCVRAGETFSFDATVTSGDMDIHVSEYESACAFINNAEAMSNNKLPKPVSAAEAVCFLLAEFIVRTAETDSMDNIVSTSGKDVMDKTFQTFQAVTVCLLKTWPFGVLRLVCVCAFFAARAGLFQSLDAAVAVFAKKTLAGIATPLSPDCLPIHRSTFNTNNGTIPTFTRAALLLFAKHEHAAIWLVLTDGICVVGNDQLRGVTNNKQSSRKTKTYTQGWLVAARLATTFSGGDETRVGKIFETMVSALKHVVRRSSSSGVGGGVSTDRDHLGECSPETAAICVLQAARGIAGRDEKDASKKISYSFDEKTDATEIDTRDDCNKSLKISTLEGLAEFAAQTLGVLTRDLETMQ